MRQVLVIGVGHFGYTLATKLAERRCEVVVVDSDREKIQDIKDDVSQAVVANASDKDALIEIGAKNFDIACVCLGEQVDVSILLTLFLKELGVKRIIAKASSDDHGRVLSMVGATTVIFPEKDEALRLANNLVSSEVLDFARISEDLAIVELAAAKEFYGKTLRELNLRKKFGIQVLAVKNPLDGIAHTVPAPDFKIRPDDVLFIIGDQESLQKFSGETLD